ncbi:uncharacterized protein LOC109725009 [Ananas comosus]|uniref:Uncharacterized protein LOC109725009 n=1 Tax=Ananas comosus TaxID=4615 RepID=A0A6P5GPC9_ANACO|nr:uncharacterized protein LOC109725009 [Ananas comosus]
MMPTAKAKASGRPRHRSLCEKSAAIAVNIVKTSSLVLAKMALGPPQSSSAAAPANRNRSHGIPPVEASAPSPAAAAADADDHQTDTRSTVAAATAPMPHPTKSYVKEPDIKLKAEEYIRMVRERHFSDATASAADLANCIPPPPQPPPAVRKWSAHAVGR